MTWRSPAFRRRPSVSAIAALQENHTAGTYRKASVGYESLNYDEAENDSIREKIAVPESQRKSLHRAELCMTWAFVLLAGFIIGSVAFAGAFAVGNIVRWKFSLVQEAQDRGDVLVGWLILSAFVLVLALCATTLTYWAPEAAGSGIPFVKAYLNGNRLDGALRPRTLVAKMLGIICCVAIGMPAGREGPMVHAGAIIASLVGTGRSRTLFGLTRKVNFHNDFDRRNFVSMGAAAGVAAAFHAPIGGILFSLEEVSSFWDPNLTLLTFFMVAVASFAVGLWGEGIHGTMDDLGLVLFDQKLYPMYGYDAAGGEASGSGSGGVGSGDSSGSHGASHGGRSPFGMWELCIFLALAIACGLAGAAFNHINKSITKVRKRKISKHFPPFPL